MQKMNEINIGENENFLKNVFEFQDTITILNINLTFLLD